MTDNEIKKALECCLPQTLVIFRKVNTCGEFNSEIESVSEITLSDIVGVINRLQESKEYYKKSRDKCQDNVMYLSKECDEWQEKCDRLQAENERLKTIAKKMHTWIFLNSCDEEKAYAECGLTDEENALLGYCGKTVFENKEMVGEDNG
jgi:hypothetical protein